MGITGAGRTGDRVTSTRLTPIIFIDDANDIQAGVV